MNNFAEHLKSCTDNKKVCLLGFGREGKSTYKMLEKYCSCSSVAICDLNPVDREANNLSDSVEIITGEKYQDCLYSFDIVFKMPNGRERKGRIVVVLHRFKGGEQTPDEGIKQHDRINHEDQENNRA